MNAKVPVYDILDCGPRRRFTANGKIVHNSKGSNLNMQNLKRGGKLRKAIRAPEGYQCVAGDLSQIEPRVLAHLSEFTELLEIFSSGQDAYAAFGSQMFGIPGLTKGSHPDLRQSAKSALLGCFGKQTKVETNNGVKRITDVKLDDLLWDGEEWVSHTGVVAQGKQKVLHCAGVWATPDHKFLIRTKWLSWEEVINRYTEMDSEYGVDEYVLETYDISNAGLRNRFTIKSKWGDLIVHNCGYGLGWANFATQLLTGFLGAPPVRYDKKFAKQLGIGPAHIEAFFSGSMGEERAVRLQDIPHTCTKEELVIHAVCAWEIINRYRAASEPVVNFWEFLTRMLMEVLAVPDAEPVTYKCLTFMPGKIILPNGLPIIYDKIESEPGPYGKPKYTYWNGKTRKNLYFGILAENVTSGTARCIIADGMLRVQKKYPIAMPVHDELVVVVKDAEIETATDWIKEQMLAPCLYLPGIPLDAEVKSNRSYGYAK